MFGSVLMLWAFGALLKRSDLPSIREYFKVVHLWEILVQLAVWSLLIVSFVVPWAISGQVVDGILGFVGASLLLLLAMIPLIALSAIRDVPLRGTYWVGTQFRDERLK